MVPVESLAGNRKWKGAALPCWARVLKEWAEMPENTACVFVGFVGIAVFSRWQNWHEPC
jgi:hypothetical protein